MLIVRENKTYDSVLGDSGLGTADPSLVLCDEAVTPNLHALAKQFANHDNFNSDAESSVQGHPWPTSSFVSDWIERTWVESYRGNSGFASESALPKGQPDFGTFVTHLIAHGGPFTNFGDVVRTLGEQGDDSVINHTGPGFPGLLYDTDIKDELKAQYVAKRLVEDDEFPAFLYVLPPNVQTVGLSNGKLTPNSMVDDQDYATGPTMWRSWEKQDIDILFDSSHRKFRLTRQDSLGTVDGTSTTRDSIVVPIETQVLEGTVFVESDNLWAGMLDCRAGRPTLQVTCRCALFATESLLHKAKR